MEVIASLIKIKPNSLDVVQEWSKTINNRLDEAIETLKDEGVQVESWFHLSLNGKDYLLCYMRVESLEKSQRGFKDSAHGIDEYHKTFQKEAWVSQNNATLLVDILNS